MCGKRTYPNKLEAKIALASTQFKSNFSSKRTEQRIYFCLACKGWHLTSKR